MALYTRKKEKRMSSKPKRNGSTEADATSTQAETGEVSVGDSAPDEEIRRRAFEIYLERGEQPGRDLDDWLQAERELERGVLLRSRLVWKGIFAADRGIDPRRAEPRMPVTDAEKIADALRAGPVSVTKDATLLDWPSTPGGEYRILRKGSSQWTCLPAIPG